MVNDRKPSAAAPARFTVGDDVRAPVQMRDSVGYAIRRAQLRVYQHFYEALADLETTPVRFTLMLLIRENPGIRSVDLARTLDVARSGMVKLLDDLEQRGFLLRETLPGDRRNQALTLTATGRRKLRQIERTVERHEAQVTGGLSPAERKKLLQLLWRVAA